jgi:GNAT superfamily N-acetyltransferase
MVQADYNLEEEYGWFIDGVLNYVDKNPDEFLEHYGVKGMHWGVRKDRNSSPLTNFGPSKIVRKTASGEELTLEKNPPAAIHKALAKLSKTYRRDYANFASLTIRDSSGNSVGSAQVHKKSADELNLVWMTVDKSVRGKGYATATMKAAEDFARQSGVKKMTLEVPGNAPDARHIYEKHGFKVTKEADDADTDPVWGGLTEMEYNIRTVKHAGIDLDQFLAHISNTPWIEYTAADYTPEQWHRACLIHLHQGAPTSKSECKLPVRTPQGALNRNGVHAAAAALAGARGGVQASGEQLASAKTALRRLYSELGDDVPDSLKQSATDVDEFIVHYGVKGMHWGVRSRSEGGGSGRKRSRSVKEPTHEDFARATTLHARAKSGGTKVLSNREMQDVIARMNLEQQYSKLTVGEGKAGGNKVLKGGSKMAGGILRNVGQQIASEILKGHAMAFVVKKGLTASK